MVHFLLWGLRAFFQKTSLAVRRLNNAFWPERILRRSCVAVQRYPLSDQ